MLFFSSHERITGFDTQLSGPRSIVKMKAHGKLTCSGPQLGQAAYGEVLLHGH